MDFRKCFTRVCASQSLAISSAVAVFARKHVRHGAAPTLAVADWPRLEYDGNQVAEIRRRRELSLQDAFAFFTDGVPICEFVSSHRQICPENQGLIAEHSPHTVERVLHSRDLSLELIECQALRAQVSKKKGRGLFYLRTFVSRDICARRDRLHRVVFLKVIRNANLTANRQGVRSCRIRKRSNEYGDAGKFTSRSRDATGSFGGRLGLFGHCGWSGLQSTS